MPEGQADGPASAGAGEGLADAVALAVEAGVAEADADAVASTGGEASCVGSGVVREHDEPQRLRIDAHARSGRFTTPAGYDDGAAPAS
jgi:hypothetical protein